MTPDPIEAALEAFYGAPGVGKDAPDEIRADMSRAIAAYDAARWKEIASAPTDGTVVLVWAQTRYDVAGEPLWGFQTTASYHSEAGWCVDELRHVTHWQPLPAAPKGE